MGSGKNERFRVEELAKIAAENNYEPFKHGEWVCYLDKIRFDRMGQVICEMVIPREYMNRIYPLFGAGRTPLMVIAEPWVGPSEEEYLPPPPEHLRYDERSA